MKKNYYLVQVAVTYSSPCFLPYSAGCIAAYLKQDKEISAHYNIPEVLVMREKPEDIVQRISSPDFVAFSCFIWNFEYNKTVARLLKNKYPDNRFLKLWNTAIAALSIGSVFAGVLEIYGTTNSLIIVYPIAGGILMLLSLASLLIKNNPKQTDNQMKSYDSAA